MNGNAAPLRNGKGRFFRNGVPRMLRNGKASRIRNVQACLFLIALLFALLLLISPQALHALAATPTPTLRPIPPTPTSAYIYLRPTPTALTINISPLDVPFNTDAGGLSDLAINMYRYVNRDHVVDFIGSGLLAVFAVGFIIKLAGRSTKDD
jgi:hypothetical protein